MNQEIEENLEDKVQQALDSIRPFLKNDGGDIELIDIKEDIVYVRLLGNCSGCHISNSTMKLGVENTVKQFVPSIKEVINIE